MRTSTQILAGYLLAVAAVVAVGVTSHFHLRSVGEGAEFIGQEWRELDAITSALAAIHAAQEDPRHQSRLPAVADRLDRFAAHVDEEGTTDEHEAHERRMFREIAAILRSGAGATRAELDAIEEKAHGIAIWFWREEEDRVPRSLAAIERRREGLILLNLVIGASILLLPVLFFVHLRRAIARPLAAIQRRVAAIGEFAPGESQAGRGMAGLATTIERMASSVERRQQQLHEQVASRTEQLRHADRLGGLGKIAAALAHEIGNPLGSIGLCIDGLKRSLGEGRVDEEVVRRYLDTVRGEIDRCTAITRRMLGYARYRATPTEDVEVAVVLRQALDLVAGHARRARVTLALDDRADGARIHGDVAQLQQVVVNLLLNAVDASSAGQQVHVTAERAGGEVAVRVIDQGAGIAASDRESVFLPFFTTKRPGEGTGLGLAISREIIEAHGGRLLVRDADGPGATLEASLPLAARNGA